MLPPRKLLHQITDMTGSTTHDAILRAGVVGAGFFGRLHAQKYAGLPNVTLVGIADPVIQARAAAAATLNCTGFAGWRDLIGKVDIASVASPASTHAEAAIGLLNAGIHVLVEKPIAITLDDASAVIAAAERAKCVLTVGHQERYVFAQSGMLSRALKPTEIECVREGTPNGRGTDVSIVLDLMIHDIDLVHQIFPSAPQSVAAMTRAPNGDAGDDVVADVGFANCRVRLTASRIARERKRTMRIVYPDGVIAIDFLARTLVNTTPEKLKPAFQGIGQDDPRAPRISNDPLGYAIGRFVHEVRTGVPTLIRPAEARTALATALRIIKAATTGGGGN